MDRTRQPQRTASTQHKPPHSMDAGVKAGSISSSTLGAVKLAATETDHGHKAGLQSAAPTWR
jgi:hypothetical protein